MAPELYRTKLVDNDERLKMMDVYSFGKMCEYMLSEKEIISIFGSDKIVSMCLDASPQKRPKVSAILLFINPMLVFQSKNSSSANRKSSSNKKTLRSVKTSKNSR
jgi:hypothetical protein